MAAHAGGSLVERPVAFTTDSKHMMCCSGAAVKLFSCETGALLRVLEGHTEDVTAVSNVASNVFQGLSAGLDGRILLWDLDDATILRAFCVGRPILAMSLHATMPSTAFVLTSPEGKAAPAGTPRYAEGLAHGGRTYAASLRVTKRSAKRAKELAARGGRRDGDGGGGDGALAAAAEEGDEPLGPEEDASGAFGSLERPWPAELRPLFRAKATALAVAACGEESAFVAAVSGSWLTVHDVAERSTAHFRQRREKRAALLCVALSPTERLAATADELGRIHLWRIATRDAAAREATGASSSDGAAREMHWHAQALAALSFSVDGGLVLSAGREGVLVFWQTHGAERNFLPRLGAPLLGMTPSEDGSTLALRSEDNSVQLVDLGARSVRRVIYGLRRAARVISDPRRRAVVLYGGDAAASLQWWSPSTDAHLGSLAAAPANLSGSLPAVGSSRDARRSYRGTAAAGGTSAPRVTDAALSADGSHLATFEVRANAELRQHTCLKLWQQRDGAWTLVTRVPQPHAGTLTALTLHPTLLIALTAAHDAKFKLWEAIPPAAPAPGPGAAEPAAGSSAPLPAGSAVGGWACRSVGFYRQSAATAAAFSSDGSVMAVAYAPDVITLWEPLTNGLLATLSQPLEASDGFVFLAFPGDGSTLIAHTSRAVFCFSLLTSHVLWAYQAPEVLAAAADPCSDATLVAVALAMPSAPRSADGRCTSFAILEFDATSQARSDGAAGAGGATMGAPRRAWRLSEVPRSVGFLHAEAGGRGTPLCLGAGGELHFLRPEGRAAPAPGERGAGAGGRSAAARTSLRHAAPSRLESIFGANAVPEELTAAPGLLGMDVEEEEAASASGRPTAAAASRAPGWEGRAIDEWLERNLSRVPSHLLPPVRVLFPRLLGELVLPAPHLATANGGAGAGSDSPEPPSELERVLAAAAHAQGRGGQFSRLVELYTPAVRRGSLTATERKRKKAALASGGVPGDADDGAGGAAKAALAEDLLCGGGEEDGPVAKMEEEAAADEAGVDEAGEGSEGGNGASGAGDSNGGSETWPPRGWKLAPLGELPNPGYLVRELGDLREDGGLGWDGEGPPPGLSAADAAFWREHAMGSEALDAICSLAAEEGGPGAAADAAAGGELLVWDAEDESPHEIWQRVLASGDLAGVQLPGATAEHRLAREIQEAEELLSRAGLDAGACGYGIARGPMPTDMRQPPTPGWQHAPTKLELKALAAELREQTRGGGAHAHLDVLAAGLLASNSRVARRAAAAGAGEAATG